eukprot:273694-Pelagomonas_calceolata.AAC.1
MGILIASGNKGKCHTSHSRTRTAVLLRGRGTNMLSAFKIPMQDLLADLRYRQRKVWREADALSP